MKDKWLSATMKDPPQQQNTLYSYKWRLDGYLQQEKMI